MARFDSNSTEVDGQYPAPAFAQFGLPAQTFGTGAPGTSPTSSEIDVGETNEPGQYPSRETFTGVALGGTGAPGSAGIPSEYNGGEAGPQGDTVTYSLTTFYKGMNQPGGMEQGNVQASVADEVGGPSDWTAANDMSYGPGWNMPGVEGNTPAPGSGQFQTGAGNIMYGGRLNGTEHTSKHPSWSGPGT